MYLSYIEICCSPANDAAKIEGGKNGINQGKSKLSLPSDDFATLAQNSIFRDLLSIEDAGYADFVQNVLAWSSNEKNYEDELIEVNRETEIQWPLVKAQKTAILAIGQSFTKKTALVTVISPTDKNGVYAYIDEEVVENA